MMGFSISLGLGSCANFASGSEVSIPIVLISGTVTYPALGEAAQTGLQLSNNTEMPAGATANWQRNGTDIAGATNAQYTPVIGSNVADGDTIRLRVDDNGAQYFSAGYTVRYAAPTMIGQPAWSTAVANEGGDVTLIYGTASAGAVREIDYLTLDGLDNLSGLVGTTYTADTLGTVAYREVWTSSGGTIYSDVIGFTIEPAAPEAGSFAPVNEQLGAGIIDVDLGAAFTSTRPLVFAKDAPWGSISGSILSLALDSARNESILITATDDYGQSAQATLQVSIAAAGASAFTYLETFQDSGTHPTTITKTDYAIGAPDPARRITFLLGGYWRSGTASDPASVTITPNGGNPITMTETVMTGSDDLSMWSAAVPTGTAATIEIEHTANNGAYILVTGIQTTGYDPEVAGYQSLSAVSGSATITQDVLAGDELLFIGTHTSSWTLPLTLTGINTRLASDHAGHLGRRQIVGSASITADESRAITLTGDANGNNYFRTITLLMRAAEAVVIPAQTGEIDVEIGTPFTIPSGYYGAGTYTVTTGDLADNVEFIFPALIEGEVLLGAPLARTQGAIYAYTGTAPVPEYNWQADGIDVTGAVDPENFDTTNFAGAAIRLRTTAGGASSYSNTITVNALDTLEFSQLASVETYTTIGGNIAIPGYALGFPHAAREIVIITGGYFRSGSGNQPLSVTITPDGESEIALVQDAGASTDSTAVWRGIVPTGTHGTVAIIHSASNGVGILTTGLRLRGHQFAVAATIDTNAASGSQSISQNVQAGDEVVALMSHTSSSQQLTLSGLTPVLASSHIGLAENRKQQIGVASISATQTPRAMSWTGTANGNAGMKTSILVIRKA